MEQPKAVVYYLRGHHLSFVYYCLTIKELLGVSPKMVIDVGASSGDFSKTCEGVFKNVKIIAFEPHPKAYELLKKKKVVAFNFALSDLDGESRFNISTKGGEESSLLEGDIHKHIAKIKVKTKRFDSLDLNIERPCYVKIDVEGAEEKVIRGFGEKLKEIDVIQVELCFRNYYKGQSSLKGIVNLLDSYGFRGFIQKGVCYDDNLPIPSQCDLIFFNQNN